MCTARPSWRSMTIADMAYKKYMFNINVHLDGIISINAKNQVSIRNSDDYTVQYLCSLLQYQNSVLKLGTLNL